jgi:hypothetical protein
MLSAASSWLISSIFTLYFLICSLMSSSTHLRTHGTSWGQGQGPTQAAHAAPSRARFPRRGRLVWSSRHRAAGTVPPQTRVWGPGRLGLARPRVPGT